MVTKQSKQVEKFQILFSLILQNNKNLINIQTRSTFCWFNIPVYVTNGALNEKKEAYCHEYLIIPSINL